MRHPVTLPRQLSGCVIFTNPGVPPVAPVPLIGQPNAGNSGPLG